MVLKRLRFLSAQPATLYYAWQVEVMINNFMEMGVNPNFIDVVCWKQNGVIPQEWLKLASKYPARFFFYDDTRKTKYYISSIRPNIIKQHFEQHSYLNDDVIFYHDSDILFTKPVNNWITDEHIYDTNWYGSDTRWYIGHSYIKGKGQDVIDKMCEIMEMDEKVIEDNELNAIGAQYLMKGINSAFWERVETDCEKLYKQVSELNTYKKQADPTHHELQIWCADMWAVLWGAWRLGYTTLCHPNYEFSWGTSTADDFNNMNIFHNAGVTTGDNGLFYKAQFMNKLPYNEPLDIKEGTASWHYWDWIQKVSHKSAII